MTTFIDFSVAQCFQHGTTFLLGMRTTGKLAIIDIRLKFTEAMLQFIFEDNLEFFQIHSRETRCIRNQCTIVQLINFHMAGRMTAAAQLLANITGINCKTLIQRI